MVDLNAAALGDYQNRELIDRIVAELDTPVQVAGGIRSHIEAARLIRNGAWRVVMGTAAIEEQIMIWDLCREYPGKIAVSLDVRPDQEIVTQGFSERSGRYLEEVLLEMSSAGVASFLVAEAGRDPLTESLDLDIYAEVLELVPEPVIVAGGVGSVDDLRTLSRVVGLRPKAAGGDRGQRGDPWPVQPGAGQADGDGRTRGARAQPPGRHEHGSASREPRTNGRLLLQGSRPQ